MMTVHEVSKLTGVSIRTLQYYDKIELLILKREHINNLISLARGIQLTGGRGMDFTAFDTKKLDEYAREARESWGSTKAYKEFEAKNGNKTLTELKQTGNALMAIVAEFGQMKERDASDQAVQDQVRKLQDFITEHYYTCTDEILSGLGKMYAGGGEFTKNIDEAGGEGTAEFANKAIQFYCKQCNGNQ